MRLIGVLCVIMGVGSLFNPLQKLTGNVPVLGNIVGTATGLISFVIGLAISLIVIAIAWFRFRPILSIILIAVVIGLIAYLKINEKKQANNKNKSYN